MNILQIFGIFLMVVGLIFGFSGNVTGFAVSENFLLSTPFIEVIFVLGVLIFLSGRNISGGLEKALNDDIIGVVTFVRHGEKEDQGPELEKKLTPKGEEQARALGLSFKEIYAKRNERDLYLASSSSPISRAYKTVKEIMGNEPRYNKPIVKDERLLGAVPEKAMKKYLSIFKKKGQQAADDWYLNSKYGEESAEGIASFLVENEGKFRKISEKGRKFHYIAGTHAGIAEALLQRVIIREDGKVGIRHIADVGGTLDFAEPINFLFKRDGTYSVNFRDKVYDIDAGEMHKLAGVYQKK
jgi:broad specificity phosphatase PhoE